MMSASKRFVAAHCFGEQLLFQKKSRLEKSSVHFKNWRLPPIAGCRLIIGGFAGFERHKGRMAILLLISAGRIMRSFGG